MGILLRPADADDLMAVGALHHRSRLAAYRRFVPVSELTAVTPQMLGRWWVERWPHERETHLMTVAERDGRLAGFTYVGPYQPADPVRLAVPGPGERGPADWTDLGELYSIHLDPSEQGQGVGRALMVDALSTLHKAGYRQAGLWVYAENAHARRFYERGGWTRDGAEQDGVIGSVVARQFYYRRPLP